MSHCIAIDGPAGAGKSTIAKEVAKRLGFIYVDTGAMYRAMALFLIRMGIDANDTESISKSCKDADITIEYVKGEQQVILNGENVNTYIRTEEVGNMASASSINKDVRIKLVELQRKLAAKTNVIMDGRDIGTYVLPNADTKIYLTASVNVRANRRYKELMEKQINCNLKEIEEDIVSRDNRDMNREFAPLKQASDAVLVDTSDMEIEEVIQTIISIYKKKRAE